MTEEIDDALDILDEDIELSNESSSIDLVGTGTKEDEDIDDLGDLDDLMKADDDGDDDLADLNDIDNLLSAAKAMEDEQNEPDSDPKAKDSTTADPAPAKENDQPMEVNAEESSDSSIVKLEKPNEADVQSIDETSSSPTKAPSPTTNSPEPAKEPEPITINSENENDKTTSSSKPLIKEKIESINSDDAKAISTPNLDIIQLQNLHSSEKLKLEQEVRRLKNENEILQTRLTAAERALKTREKSTADLVKQISKLTREKKAYEDQVRFWRNKANQVEKEINDSVQAKQQTLKEELKMSNKKLKLMKTGHNRKTTEMEIQMRRLEEKQSAMNEEHELPSEVTELHAMTLNLKLELRMKDAEMKVLQERLTDYKSQIQFKDVAENLQNEIKDMQEEVALVQENKKQIIRTLTSEIEDLRRTVIAYVNRPPAQDLKAGIIKGYHFSRTTAEKVYTKIFSPTPTDQPQRDDRNAKSWG